MTTRWNSRIATIPLLVLCTCALLFGLGGLCDKTKLTVTSATAAAANATLGAGEHRVETGRYVRVSGNGSIGIHRLNETQAIRYVNNPDSGNYVGNWTAGAAGYGPRRFCPADRIGPVSSSGSGRGTGKRTVTPTGRGGTRTSGGHSH